MQLPETDTTEYFGMAAWAFVRRAGALRMLEGCVELFRAAGEQGVKVRNDIVDQVTVREKTGRGSEKSAKM